MQGTVGRSPEELMLSVQMERFTNHLQSATQIYELVACRLLKYLADIYTAAAWGIVNDQVVSAFSGKLDLALR
jgi:hypothetical protein